jgi:uncharacterized protein (DUF1810 family)
MKIIRVGQSTPLLPGDDAPDLSRFVTAQDQVYKSVITELAAGQKQGHWMWFVFPQVRGLGRTAMANEFALASKKQAASYMEHPVLGARLRQCTKLVINVGRTADQIFPFPDNLKFRSSMTLFAESTPDELFKEALLKNCEGESDQLTLDILSQP